MGLFGQKPMASFPKEGAVYILNDSLFDPFMVRHPTVLVMFYSPTCPRCAKIFPSYSEAATLVSIPLAKVDATAEKQLRKRYDITKYPTINFYENGDGPHEYDGGTETKDIVSWVHAYTEPLPNLTSANFDQFVKKQALCLAMFYDPDCPRYHRIAPEFSKAAEELREYGIKLVQVDATTERDLARKFEVKHYPLLVVLRRGKRSYYKGMREASGIVAYMKEQAEIIKAAESIR